MLLTTAELNQFRNKIINQKGGWVIGEAVFSHGYDLLNELVGHYSYFQILILSITGKTADRATADWLEGFYGTISWPDPRIWCNQISALAGQMKSDPVSAVTAACLASDARLYGPGTLTETVTFIQQACLAQQQGKEITAIITAELERKAQTTQGKAVIIGYSRPIATGDERVPVLKKLARKLGFAMGAHEALSEKIHDYVLLEQQEGINIGGYAAAFLADQGFTATEVYRLCSLLVNAGAQACYAEYRDKPAGQFLPLQCTDIDYIGKPKRTLPNA